MHFKFPWIVVGSFICVVGLAAYATWPEARFKRPKHSCCGAAALVDITKDTNQPQGKPYLLSRRSGRSKAVRPLLGLVGIDMGDAKRAPRVHAACPLSRTYA